MTVALAEAADSVEPDFKYGASIEETSKGILGTQITVIAQETLRPKRLKSPACRDYGPRRYVFGVRC